MRLKVFGLTALCLCLVGVWLAWAESSTPQGPRKLPAQQPQVGRYQFIRISNLGEDWYLFDSATGKMWHFSEGKWVSLINPPTK
jgi:hypothetical protein